jgi:hypothetical protein
MAHQTLPPEPRTSSISNALAAAGLMLVMASLVAGIVLSTDALDVREAARTLAWLIPAAIAGLGALLAGVIVRFGSILASLRLRMQTMRDHLPALINANQRGN